MDATRQVGLLTSECPYRRLAIRMARTEAS